MKLRATGYSRFPKSGLVTLLELALILILAMALSGCGGGHGGGPSIGGGGGSGTIPNFAYAGKGSAVVTLKGAKIPSGTEYVAYGVVIASNGTIVFTQIGSAGPGNASGAVNATNGTFTASGANGLSFAGTVTLDVSNSTGTASDSEGDLGTFSLLVSGYSPQTIVSNFTSTSTGQPLYNFNITDTGLITLTPIGANPSSNRVAFGYLVNAPDIGGAAHG